MAIRKSVFVISFLVTVIILMSVIFSNMFLSEEREEAVVERMNDIVNEYEEMQTLFFMSEFFGEEATCVALESMLSSMNEELWDLGVKIDSYRQVTEEFTRSPFYVDQKTEFNRRAVLYYSMLRRMKEMCDVNQTIMSYFYKKKEDCPDCDEQSFVLTDIRHDLEDKDMSQSLALFSFDANIDIPSLQLLTRYYNISEYPCLLIGDSVHCGLYRKDDVLDLLCNMNSSACYEN